jgi:hypothetical protein
MVSNRYKFKFLLKQFSRFLLARLHLDSMVTRTTRRNVKCALVSLPEGLDMTYDEAMGRFDGQDSDQAELARTARGWTFYAARPLTVKEVLHALAVEPGDTYLHEDRITDEDTLASVCTGLVTIQRESNMIGLAHYTTPEYIESREADLFPYAQIEIARTCLTYLLFDEFGRELSSIGEEMEARLQKTLFFHTQLSTGENTHAAAPSPRVET